MDESKPPEYSDESFWEKLKRYAIVAGEPVVEKALQLYYTMKSSKTPAWAKAVIASALVYFIWPFDAIPDVIPFGGYADDFGALAAAGMTVAAYVTGDIKQLARAKVEEWFGKKENPSDSEIEDKKT